MSEVPHLTGLLTVGGIAAKAGVPVHSVVYVINSRGIQPVGRVGQTRVFDPAAVGRVVAELARMS